MKVFDAVKELHVSLNFNPGHSTIPVGRLAFREGQVYFQYDSEFVDSGLEISPFHLPLSPGLKTFDRHLFEGLPGVFNDSLPDGWGRLLVDRLARSHGIQPEQISPLDRLAFVGNQGTGALVYEPDYNLQEADTIKDGQHVNLQQLATESRDVLRGEPSDVLEDLVKLNGSSAGARPKAFLWLNHDGSEIIHQSHAKPHNEPHNESSKFTPWLVKFPNLQDGPDAGAIEYCYALMAKDAGVEMPDVKLLNGYFAVKRFDHVEQRRFHAHTACGLLHSDYRTPALDYEQLLALAGALTRDIRQVETMYRLAVFNVLAFNRDDHSKNFSFLMNPDGQWRMAPAYDLTFSSGPGGEQSTTVLGEGKNPGTEQLLKLAETGDISKSTALEIIEKTRTSLEQWPELAANFGVSKASLALVSDALKYGT